MGSMPSKVTRRELAKIAGAVVVGASAGTISVAALPRRRQVPPPQHDDQDAGVPDAETDAQAERVVVSRNRRA
jgi:hypothetical protein